MSSRILKGIAIAAGTGLVVGVGGKRRRQSELMKHSLDDNQVLERLDRIEARLSAVEESYREVPASALVKVVEATLAPQVESLRLRLDAEMREAMETRLTTFEESIDQKVSARMNALEKAVVDQSKVITALSTRAVEAEENFQRLISAVEKLCAQREAGQVPSASTNAPFELPFEKHLNDAFRRPAATAPDRGFRPRIVSEEESKSQRHRRPMSGMR